MKQYKTIVVDPPWPYKGGGPVGTGGRGKGFERARPSCSSVSIYGSMSIEELKRLRINEIAAERSHLYLWTTNSFILEAHELLKAWGFTYKTMLTWTKVKDDGSPSSKTGYYFRSATEHVLFGVRGNMPLMVTEVVSNAMLHRRLPHSVKPDAFYSMVEEVSMAPRLDVFGRRRRKGWDIFGSVHNDIDLNPDRTIVRG